MRHARDHQPRCYGAPHSAHGRFHFTQACPRQATSLELSDAEDGLVVPDAVRQTVHHLNVTPSMIFELCDGTNDTQAIAHKLAAVYHLDAPPTETRRRSVSSPSAI